jgi:hypothetical protein
VVTGSGGSTGMGGVIGTGGSGPAGRGGGGGTMVPPTFGRALGTWTFDDCTPQRTNLQDTAFQNNIAFRSVSAACTEGIGGQAIALANKEEDIVYVPDQPTFDFSTGVTVAGWFNHSAIGNTRTLFRKRDDASSSAFALVLNNQKYEWVVNLGKKAVSIVSPKKAKVNEWTHVAASYDGFTLRLYVDGILVVAKGVTGTIVPAAGPFLMGNDGSKRMTVGRMDQTFLASVALTDQEVKGLTCLRRTPTLVGTPPVSEPTGPNVPVAYDIALTNNDTATCTPSDFIFRVESFFPGISIDPQFQPISQVPAGGTAHLTMNAIASDDVDSGTFTIQFSAFNLQRGTAPVSGSVDFVVVQSGCRVSTARELMITNLGVVDDPRAVGSGAWSFKHLMEEMAPTAADAPAMVENVISSFLTNQTVNGFTTPPRPNFQFLLDAWPRTPDGKLDLAQAPLKLNAIVNRFDLRNLANGDAGEGRFVFAFQNPFDPQFPLQATLILEYKLPASTPEEILAWANAWHNLGAMDTGSPAYNEALQAITDKFSKRGARPGHPNDNAINAVRTNEIDFGINGIWELREFVLSSSTGMLVPATVKLTPDLKFNNSATLASFINANEAAIIAETHDVPEQFQDAPFLAGAVLNDFSTLWNAPGINLEARHHFAVNTCNGCHSAETNVSFLQIFPRFPGGEAGLSGFLTGTTVFDPFSGTFRTFNDLARRRTDLRAQVCPGDPMPPPPPPPPGPGTGGRGGTGTGGTTGGGTAGRTGTATTAPLPAMPIGTLTKGINRVH